MNVPQLYDACDSILAQKIAQVPGVGQTFCGGSAKPGVRIEANPMQLAHYGIGLEALRAAIGTVNVNQPKGYLQDDERRWSISATDQLFGAAAYAPLIVATDRGPVSSAPARSGLPASVASAVANVPHGECGKRSAAQAAWLRCRLRRRRHARGQAAGMELCGSGMWRRSSTALRTFRRRVCSTASRRFWCLCSRRRRRT